MKCAICNAEKVDHMPKLDRFVNASGNHCLYHCSACGLIQRFALPPEDNNIENINLRYGEYTSGGDTVNFKMIKRLKMFDQLIQTSSKKLLDIGCGTGSFIDYANKNGWEAIGTELNNENSTNSILNIDLTLETHPKLKNEYFDFININHVIEHVESPKKLLQNACLLLRPAGYMCIEVPNEFSSLTAIIKMILGIKYNSATAYYQHRNFFSKKSLQILVKTLPELKIIKLSTPFSYYNQFLLKKWFDKIQSSLGYGAVIELIAQKQ